MYVLRLSQKVVPQGPSFVEDGARPCGHVSKALGGNAVVAARFSTAEMMQGAAELMVYGTAVLVEDE